MTGRVYSAQWLDEITKDHERWTRRCNGMPLNGVPISRSSLRLMLAASENVFVNPDGVIIWDGPAGQFTAAPVLDVTA